MGRIKVTPKGKVKKNIPITRVGKKQYLKRRFAHVRVVDNAGADNVFTQKYFKGSSTAEQTFTRLGLAVDPSATKKQIETRKKRVKPHMRRRLEEENMLQESIDREKATKIARPVSEQEGSTIANLIQRYGMDLKRMTLDSRLNPFQLNTRQLQRQIVNYLKWEKAAFPKEFEEAEKKGWFSVEQYANPQLRVGRSAPAVPHAAAAATVVVEDKTASKPVAAKAQPASPAAKKKKAAKKA